MLAAWAAAASLLGAGRPAVAASGARGLDAASLLALLAAAGLWRALLAADFSVAFVAAVGTSNLPVLYRLAAPWAGPSGALLLWAAVLGACAAAGARALRRAGGSSADAARVATGILAALLALAIAAACLGTAPFARLDPAPDEGHGLAPALQAPSWALHGPLLWAGCGAAAVPFAAAAAALGTRSSLRPWLPVVRGWMLAAWALMGVALALELRYGYAASESHAGWARSAWSGVALPPWVLATVAVHAMTGRVTRRDRRRLLAGLGVFAIAMVAVIAVAGGGAGHEGGPRPLAPAWVSLLLAPAVGAVVLVALRLRELEPPPFASLTTAVLTPAPHRLGGHLAHAGAALALLGLAGSALSREVPATLSAGEAFETRDPLGQRWRFVSQGVYSSDELNRHARGVALEAWRGDSRLGLVRSERRQYVDGFRNPLHEPVSVAGLLTTPPVDVHVALDDVGDDDAPVDLRITFDPLTVWTWLGAALMAVGGALALWSLPARDRRDEPAAPGPRPAAGAAP